MTKKKYNATLPLYLKDKNIYEFLENKRLEIMNRKEFKKFNLKISMGDVITSIITDLEEYQKWLNTNNQNLK